MDDRKLKEYALKIFQGVSGYSLNKAFSLFPKYYPKIAYYYSEIAIANQQKLTESFIRAIGINKAIIITREYQELNNRIIKLKADVEAKFKVLYDKLDNATDPYEKDAVYKECLLAGFDILFSSTDVLGESCDLLLETMKESKKYKFGQLQTEINKVIDVNYKANNEIAKMNKKFSNYLKEYQYKEL